MTTAREICLSFDEDLSALRDGELSSERAAEVEAHLAGCERCRARLASFEAVDADLHGIAAPRVAGDLESRLLARLADERSAAAQRAAAQAAGAVRPVPDQRGRAPRRPGRTFAFVAAIASAAAAAVVYLAVARSPGPLGPQGPVAQRQPGAAAAVRETPGRDAGADLDAASDEDLSVAIELETLEDLEVIANLDVLEEIGPAGGKDNG